MRRHAFYRGLVAIQHGRTVTAAKVSAARRDARAMRVGWVVIWQRESGIDAYLAGTGFRFDYRADGVSVYRPAAGSGAAGDGQGRP
jgi:hypothetical protein